MRTYKLQLTHSNYPYPSKCLKWHIIFAPLTKSQQVVGQRLALSCTVISYLCHEEKSFESE